MPLHYFSGEEMRDGDYVLLDGTPAIVQGVAEAEADLEFVARAGAAVFTPMATADYDALHEILRHTPGVTLRAADSREAMERYLVRNPGLSLLARVAGKTVACILCGHDGRRGYLHHLAVIPEARRQGIATLLVAHCVVALRRIGIEKVHADVLAENEPGHQFWTRVAGWLKRDDIVRYSFTSVDDPNA